MFNFEIIKGFNGTIAIVFRQIERREGSQFGCVDRQVASGKHSGKFEKLSGAVFSFVD